jgi:putative transposase
MSTRQTAFAPGEYYHLYNRGNSKQKIFNGKQDYQRFLKLLYLANSSKAFHFMDNEDHYAMERGEGLVSIGAYCLMPNHFHLLIKVPENGDVSNFMKKLGTAYSMYFNTRYDRSGALFEGKFKSEHLDSDNYLKYIFSYIHLNPMKIMNKDWRKTGIKDQKLAEQFLNNYDYSSYADYMKRERIEVKILNLEDFPAYFPSRNIFVKEISDWLTFSHEERPRGN